MAVDRTQRLGAVHRHTAGVHGVGQFHDLGDRRVEVKVPVHVTCDVFDGFMRLAVELASRFVHVVQVAGQVAGIGQQVLVLIDAFPNALQEADRPLDAAIAPLGIALRRTDEQGV